MFNLTKFKDRIIAIDGPAGSGKSTTAKLVAAKLGYSYLDTGAMYRAITHFALKHNVEPSDAERLTAIAKKLSIEFKTEEELNRIFLNGEEVTKEIREPEVTRHVSEVSAHKGVREALVARQKELGEKGSIVAEGRDTTTVVFPNADLKIFLKATVEERAQRRLIELARAGVSTTLEEQLADIERRDKFDSNRAHSPLKKASDAYEVDTSNCTIEEQVERIISLFKTMIK